MKLIADIAGVMRREGVSFALIGAGALAVHGIGRSTLDLDLLTTDVCVLDSALWSALPRDVHVDVRHGDADDPLAGVVRFTMDGERDIDVVVGRGAWQGQIVSRAVDVMIAGQAIPVVRAADLVLLKLYAGGSQDRWDIEQLLASEGDSIAGEVERQLGGLPGRCRDVWRSLRERPI